MSITTLEDSNHLFMSPIQIDNIQKACFLFGVSFPFFNATLNHAYNTQLLTLLTERFLTVITLFTSTTDMKQYQQYNNTLL